MTSAAPAQFAAPTPSGAAAAAMGMYDRRYHPLDTGALWGTNNNHPFARHDGSSSGGALHMTPAAAPAQFAMTPAPEEDIKFDSRLVLQQQQQQQVEDDDDAPPPQEAPSSDSFDGGHDAARPRDKTQRRLAQNREAARKSRLRKKVYIQNLETSRIKLAQLEQELNRTRQQCGYIGGSNSVGLSAPIDSGVAAFEVEYARWVEEQGRQARELRAALHGGAPEFQLSVLVEAGLAHYDDLFTAKSAAARSDAFFVTSGAWRSAAERLFLWIGGFRPSDLLRALSPRLEPATEQQQAAVHGLQIKARQLEDALSHGLDLLQQTLAESLLHTDAIGSADGDDAGAELARMAGAMGRLESLAGFVDQADHLRQQTLKNMRKILTPRQAAQGLVALADYCQRLRALTAFWAARPREPA